MGKKEAQIQLVENMRRWQKVENAAVTSTAQIMEGTDNEYIRAVAEIINRDSQMHYRIQQLIVDSVTKTVAMPVDDLKAVWDAIEKHIEIERRTIALATESLELLDHQRQGLQQYLLEYLLEDEKKHDNLLAKLELIKKGMYP